VSTGETFTEDVPYEQFTGPKHYSESGLEIFEGKNLYAEVEQAFKSPIYVIIYVLAMIALSYHLAHGFQSAFQTLGIRTKNYQMIIQTVGNIVFAVIIPALFAAMPIYFLFFKH
jgi:succinate dehydrogenase / fumarate reductase, cytochrome b subunit